MIKNIAKTLLISSFLVVSANAAEQTSNGITNVKDNSIYLTRGVTNFNNDKKINKVGLGFSHKIKNLETYLEINDEVELKIGSKLKSNPFGNKNLSVIGVFEYNNFTEYNATGTQSYDIVTHTMVNDYEKDKASNVTVGLGLGYKVNTNFDVEYKVSRIFSSNGVSTLHSLGSDYKINDKYSLFVNLEKAYGHSDYKDYKFGLKYIY